MSLDRAAALSMLRDLFLKLARLTRAMRKATREALDLQVPTTEHGC